MKQILKNLNYIYYIKVRCLLMGKLTNFVKWLSDDKSSSKKGVDPIRSTITGLRIFTRKLTKQVNRMEIQGKRARAKAIERRKAGDIKGSQIHMKSALQFIQIRAARSHCIGCLTNCVSE